MNDKIELPPFNVAGVQYRPANVIDVLVDGQEIRLVAEPTNEYDRFAIKIEAFVKESVDFPETDYSHWNFIGYVPKKSTWLFHLLRQANIKIVLLLIVNHNATDKDKLLVSSYFMGDKNASF